MVSPYRRCQCVSRTQVSLSTFRSGRFDALTEAEREVYIAVEEGEFGPREYARETDRSPGTVGNLLNRAREKIDA